MKKIIYCILIFSYSLVHGQKKSLKVGDNPFTINAKAALEIESISKGFLPPRMNSKQQSAITDVLIPPTPEGLTVYNTDNKTVEVYDGDSFRGTTARCYIFSYPVSIPLTDGQATDLIFKSINNNYGYNELGSSFNDSNSVLTAPSTGLYHVSIVYRFQSATWDLAETVSTSFMVGSDLASMNPQYVIPNNSLSGTRVVTYSTSITLRLFKGDLFKTVVAWSKNLATTSNKTIDYISFSIAKL